MRVFAGRVRGRGKQGDCSLSPSLAPLQIRGVAPPLLFQCMLEIIRGEESLGQSPCVQEFCENSPLVYLYLLVRVLWLGISVILSPLPPPPPPVSPLFLLLIFKPSPLVLLFALQRFLHSAHKPTPAVAKHSQTSVYSFRSVRVSR